MEIRWSRWKEMSNWTEFTLSMMTRSRNESSLKDHLRRYGVFCLINCLWILWSCSMLTSKPWKSCARNYRHTCCLPPSQTYSNLLMLHIKSVHAQSSMIGVLRCKFCNVILHEFTLFCMQSVKSVQLQTVETPTLPYHMSLTSLPHIMPLLLP